MNWNVFLGLVSTFLFLLPAVIVATSGLHINKSLLALGIYFLLNAINGFMGEGLVPVSKPLSNGFATFINYTDTPLMLVTMLLFCHTPQKRRIINALLVLTLVYEGIIFVQHGLAAVSSVYVSGPGLLLVFVCGIYFFVAQLRQTIRFGKGLGRTLISAAIFFTYGSYGIIYYFYYIQRSPDVGDVFLLYYFSSMVFCLLISVGLLQLRRMHKKVQQLLLVRRELRMFFSPTVQKPGHGGVQAMDN